MHHRLYKVIEFKIIKNYTVWVKFNDDTERVIDFKPVLHGEMWGPLQDLTLFSQVQLDPIAHTLTWPNEADFDPETLRNWPDYADELAERAKNWDLIPV